MTGCTSGGYDQFETSPEAIEQELRFANGDRLMANYSIDYSTSCIDIDDGKSCSHAYHVGPTDVEGYYGEGYYEKCWKLGILLIVRFRVIYGTLCDVHKFLLRSYVPLYSKFELILLSLSDMCTKDHMNSTV